MKNFNKIDRDFGILFGLIFLIFFFYTSYERFGEDNSNLIFLVISIILFLIAFFAPYILRPLSIIWMKLGYSLSKIVSPLLMFLLYLIINY